MVESALGLLGWAGGCWYFSGAYAQLVSIRLVYGLILTMAIGLVLALLGILYGATCWALLVLAIGFSYCMRQRTPRPSKPKLRVRWPYAIIVAAVAFIGWPSLVRPPTDGDTLIYHLPLAAAWVHAHSIWNTDTHYWWYPGGSELAAAVLLSACGLFAIPFVGAAALLTLAITAYDVALSACRHRLFSMACALALATSHVAAVQGGDLQNDVFLAAFFLALTSQRLRGNASWPIAVALAITKPSGWVYSLMTSLFTGKYRALSGLLVLTTIALWWFRNALLIRSSIDPIPSHADPNLFSTSIVAHGVRGFVTLGQSAVQDGWTTAILVVFAFGSFLGVRNSGYALMAFTAAIIWVASPYTFESGGIAQLAIGAALRFGLPAMACSTISLAQFVRFGEGRLPGALSAGGLFLAALSAYNLFRYDSIYRFDHSADFMPWVAVIALSAGLCILALRSLRRAAKIGIAMAAIVSLLILAVRDRQHANVDGYYAAMLSEQNLSPSLPKLLKDTTSKIIATSGFEAGIGAVVRPDARIIEMPVGKDACTFASEIHGVIFLHNGQSPNVQSGCTSLHPNSRDFEVSPGTSTQTTN